MLHRCRDHDRISLADFVPTAVIACSHHAIDTTKSHLIALSQYFAIHARVEQHPEALALEKILQPANKVRPVIGQAVLIE